jgi:hypothetical protein
MMRSRRRWQVGATLAVPALVIFGWYLDKTIAAELKTVVGEGLQSFLAHKVETLEEWIEEELKVAKIVAADPVIHDAIVKAVKAYDEIGPNPAELLANPDRNYLSELLQARMDAWGYPGAAVIARDGTVLTALRREYVGSKFFLTEPDIKRVVDSVMSGRSVFAGPRRSPVPVAEEPGQRATQQPVMFTAVPVRSSDSKVVAMFGFRIPLAQDFTRILHRGQMGESGETYAFNMEGLLLSASRFDKQLRRIGLLPRQDPNPRSILRVKILDPGANLVAGEEPPLPVEEQELTEMARSAVRGETGVNVVGYRDYRGVTVVGAWTWLPDRGFGVASEVDRDEAGHVGPGGARPVVLFAVHVGVAGTHPTHNAAAAEAWPVHPRGEARRGRHGSGLPGPPCPVAAAHRPEAAEAGAHPRHRRDAVRARGAAHQHAHPPEHDRHL